MLMSDQTIKKAPQTKDSLWTAYLAFQKETLTVKMNKKVKFGNTEYDYASLDAILDVVRPLLTKHGLIYRQEIKNGHVVTVVTHAKTGQSFGGVPVPIQLGEKEVSEMKILGANITYARRYSLVTTLGIAAEEDIDIPLDKETAKKAQGFAYTQAKKNIEKAETIEDCFEQVDFIQKQLGLIADGKPSAIGLNEKQLTELLKLARGRGELLAQDAPPTD